MLQQLLVVRKNAREREIDIKERKIVDKKKITKGKLKA